MKTSQKISVIVIISTVITVSHYLVDPHAGSVHDILQRVYYIPIVLAGLWFGVKGGLVTAFIITIAYLPHARHGWYGPYTFVFQASEMAMYHIIGGLCGYLSSKERRAFVAERKSREEKEEALQSLENKTRELFTVEEQLRRSDRLAALGRLSAGLAHEIRNPLGSIKTSAEMLVECSCDPCEQPNDDDDTPNFLEIIQQEADRLDRILSEFLSFARNAQNDDLPTEMEETSCIAESVFSRTVELLRPEMEKHRISTNFSIQDDSHDIAIAICPTHLQQVLLNLFLNAIEAIDSDGEVNIHVARKENEMNITIDDSGPGIPRNLAKRIFDPFVSSKESGSGLGLSIVDRILTSHGASISLDESHDPLNQFLLEIPLIAE